MSSTYLSVITILLSQHKILFLLSFLDHITQSYQYFLTPISLIKYVYIHTYRYIHTQYIISISLAFTCVYPFWIYWTIFRICSINIHTPQVIPYSRVCWLLYINTLIIGVLSTSHNTFIFIYVFQRGSNFNLTFVFKHTTKTFIYFELYTCINAY